MCLCKKLKKKIGWTVAGEAVVTDKNNTVLSGSLSAFYFTPRLDCFCESGWPSASCKYLFMLRCRSWANENDKLLAIYTANLFHVKFAGNVPDHNYAPPSPLSLSLSLSFSLTLSHSLCLFLCFFFSLYISLSVFLSVALFQYIYIYIYAYIHRYK